MSRIVAPKTHWTSVGRVTAVQGMDVKKVLTGKPTYDKWIMDGFCERQSQIERKRKSEYDMICEKAGII